jgi:YggT family protein
LLARFWMLFFRASFHNPVGGMVLSLSDWIVLPARRIVPALAGLDLASLLCAWVVQTVLLYLLLLLQEAMFGGSLELGVVTVLALSLLELARSSIYLLIGIVLLQALISWINPYSTIGPSLAPIVRPFYRPIQRLIPPIRGIDLSPVFLLVALQIVLILFSGLHTLILRSF